MTDTDTPTFDSTASPAEAATVKQAALHALDGLKSARQDTPMPHTPDPTSPTSLADRAHALLDRAAPGSWWMDTRAVAPPPAVETARAAVADAEAKLSEAITDLETVTDDETGARHRHETATYVAIKAGDNPPTFKPDPKLIGFKTDAEAQVQARMRLLTEARNRFGTATKAEAPAWRHELHRRLLAQSGDVGTALAAAQRRLDRWLGELRTLAAATEHVRRLPGASFGDHERDEEARYAMPEQTAGNERGIVQARAGLDALATAFADHPGRLPFSRWLAVLDPDRPDAAK